MGLHVLDIQALSIEPVGATTFKAEQVGERAHLQAALRDWIEVLGLDLFVVAEEFGDFEDANRRIDLLCLDRAGDLVVVELKRTEDGGHMELQALRYAAMLRTMTSDHLVSAHRKYRGSRGKDASHEATEAALRGFVGLPEGEALVNPSETPQVVLVSQEFSKEITATVLWLNEFYDMGIRCIRMTPYKYGTSLLVDVQSIIPLPEAEELMIQVKTKEAAIRAHAKEANADAKLTGSEILDHVEADAMAYRFVGRNGGITGVYFTEDLATQRWREWPYQVSAADVAPNKNWFPVEEFIEAVLSTTTTDPAQEEVQP